MAANKSKTPFADFFSAKQKKNSKKKKMRKQHPALVRFITVILVICAIGLTCACIGGGYVYKFAKDYVNGDKKIDLDEYKANQEQTSIIYGYDSNNKLIELLRLHGSQNRMWIFYEDIPDVMIDAFRDLEDKRFNDHKGVDWTRTIGGVVKSGFKEGGSTITQQLIKNLTGENGRTVSRKFYEILNALNLEKFYNKTTIMEAYLNTVYLGRGCYGIKTAAEIYFGKDVEDLNAAECAAIAAITKSPGDLDPLSEPGENRKRQLMCLNYMLENGSLTQEEYEEAVDYEMIFTNSPEYKGSQVKKSSGSDDAVTAAPTTTTESSYYVDYVIDKVISDLEKEYDLTYNEAWRKVFFGGLRIYTAVDMDVQSIAEDVYVNRKTFPDEEDTKDNPAVQSAITIMDYSGRIVAMVGGAGEKDTFRGLNRASDSPRQPGSSIKPLAVYAPAIENDVITWSTKVQNYGIRMGSSRWPVNYGGSHGSASSFVTVQYALQESYNTVPVQIMRKLGLKTSFDFMIDDLKFTTLVTDEDDPNYDGNYSSLCVGGMSQGVTSLEMTAAFSIFGNNGYYFDPYCYYKVTNNDGSEILLEAGNDSGKQVISESTAGTMRQLLKTVVSSGTGSGYGVSRFETFAKTGTTSDDKDRWFVGGTPYYVAAVWYGYDTPKKITNTSGNPAGKIFREIMQRVHEDYDAKSFPNASGVVARRYCTISGDLASSSCHSTATGYYKTSDLPATCKNCAMIHAIGSDIPDAATKPKATKPTTTEPSTKPTTTQKPGKTPKTTAPAVTPKTTVPATTAAPEPLPPETTAPVTETPVTEAPDSGAEE